VRCRRACDAATWVWEWVCVVKPVCGVAGSAADAFFSSMFELSHGDMSFLSPVATKVGVVMWRLSVVLLFLFIVARIRICIRIRFSRIAFQCWCFALTLHFRGCRECS
jgi:hypothetical protein